MTPFLFDTLFIILFIAVGGGFGAFGMFFYISQKNKNHAAEIIRNAEKEAKNILSRADQTANTIKKELQEARNDISERKKDILNTEKRLEEKENKVEKKYEELEKQQKIL